MRSPASVLVPGLALAALAAGAGPAAGSVLDECWEQATTRIELGRCLEAAELDSSDRLAALDEAVGEAQAALDELPGGKQAGAALERSRLAFELYRDLDCDLVARLADSGSGDIRRACWIDRTRQRAIELETLLEVMPTDPPTNLHENRIEGGTWLVEDIQSRGVMDYLQTTLQVLSDGGVNGFGGCNRYFGEAEIDGDKIRFGAMASSRMACPEAIMDQEGRFLAALELVRRWRVESTGLLHLLDEDGATIIRLSR